MSQLNWQKIYQDYSPKLLGICRRYIVELQTAEDILQDSFIMAIQKNHQLKDEKVLLGWLKKIVVNNALQYLRKNSKDIFVSTEISEIPDTHKEMNTSAQEEKHILAYDFTREELLRSIDSLPPHHKSVFNLYCIENHSHTEIAQLLGINVNTSKSHLLRAKKSIQNYLIITVVDESTPKNKNKITQLLVFFGFGGLLWAQTFQSKFLNFTVSPAKTFEIPEDITINRFSASSGSDKSLQKKLIIAATFFVILLISVLINKTNQFFKESPPDESAINDVKPALKNHFASEIKPEITTAITISHKNQNEINGAQKINTEKAVAVDHTPVKKVTKLKDSIKNSPRKVIIVKKIIQRDTIFIEREN